jgi:UDP-2-acetamido-2,6-beta-L-arabino-hexul-4-ose reductase
MKILVTGSEGFIAKNLIVTLKSRHYDDILEFNHRSSDADLADYCRRADFIFHLAGVNRPEDPDEFIEGNIELTRKLIGHLNTAQNRCPIVFSSTIQAEMDNPYGKSKKAAETLLLAHHEETSASVIIYRLPNVFGKWSRPNYNNVITTFSYNISRNIEIKINETNPTLQLVYIDDVIDEFVNDIDVTKRKRSMINSINIVYSKKLFEIADLIHSFKENRLDRFVPCMKDDFIRKLYATYLSYLPENEFSYPLKANQDERGSFSEFIKTMGHGQVSVNLTKPGITKGNHWHQTRNEKFLVVSGEAIIRFRHVLSKEVIAYHVSGSKLEVVDIPPGYTHNIENVGSTDLVTIMWANEPFDPNHPDTIALLV